MKEAAAYATATGRKEKGPSGGAHREHIPPVS